MTDEQHITPKDFASHLLAVIAELTEYEPNVSVPMQDTFAPTCERMGIPEDFGGETPHGAKFTHRTIGLAFRQLRDRNLGDYVKRGHWTLTAAGVAEARKITGVAAPEQEIPVEPVAARTATAETTEDDAMDAEVIPLSVHTPTHPYSDDPYIRSLAIEQVACFGAYSKRSDACKSCPITQDCLVQIDVRKAELAADLEKEEAEAAAKKAKKEAEKAKKDESVAELLDSFDESDETPKTDTKAGSKGKRARRWST